MSLPTKDLSKNISKMKKFLNPRTMLKRSKKAIANLESIYLWIIIIILLFLFAWYIHRQINKKSIIEYKMEKLYNGLPTVIGNINSADAKYKYDPEAGTGHLRDYYIASSYNSCCAGNFKDSYVSLVPLKEVILQGARVLDFALYQIDDDVVVAAGATDSDNIKGTYNSLPLYGNKGVFTVINQYAFSLPCPNPTDPLFIHLRIKSRTNPRLLYKKLTKYVRDAFSNRLLPAEYGYEGRHSDKNSGKNLAREPVLNLRNKVIIMVHQETNNFRDTAFEELVNISTGTPFFQEKRNFDIQYGHDLNQLTEYNKSNMTISMPDYSVFNGNVSPELHFNYGCQMVCMNYANNDSNMEFYREMFNKTGSAFVLKPEEQRYKIVTINAPKKQNPKLQYKAKKIDLPMYQSTI